VNSLLDVATSGVALAFLEFEDRPGRRRFRDELALLDANLKLDHIDTAGGSHDAENGIAVTEH